MQNAQLVGVALVMVGLVDVATSLWVPNRIADERQRRIVRLALLSSGIVVVALGGLFLSGFVGQPVSLEAE